MTPFKIRLAVHRGTMTREQGRRRLKTYRTRWKLRREARQSQRPQSAAPAKVATRESRPCKRCGEPTQIVWSRLRRFCETCWPSRMTSGPRRVGGYKSYRKDSCESCGWKPPTIKALDVDHILPRSMGGTHHPSNLRTLCPNCHRLKTLAERGLYAKEAA